MLDEPTADREARHSNSNNNNNSSIIVFTFF